MRLVTASAVIAALLVALLATRRRPMRRARQIWPSGPASTGEEQTRLSRRSWPSPAGGIGLRLVTPSRVLALVTVVLLGAWLLLLRPVSLGGPVTYVMIKGTSMEPALHEGDLAVVKKQDRYAAGDVVAFHAEDSIVIHRIRGGSEEKGFVTQGDNKGYPDTWRPRESEIVGRMWFHVPGGRPLSLFREPVLLALMAAAVAVSTVLPFPRLPLKLTGSPAQLLATRATRESKKD